LWIGIPVGLSTASIALGMGSVNKILSLFGHRTVSAWMLGLRVEELAFNISMGINMALIPYIAFNYGKRDLGRMLGGLKSAILLCMILMCSVSAVLYVFPGIFLGRFRPSAEISEMAAHAIRASIPGYPFAIVNVMICSFFVGTGYSLCGSVTQLIRSVFARIIAAWIFVNWLGVDHVWWFQSSAQAAGFLIAITLLFYVLSRIRREFEETPAKLKPRRGAS
jgi:Na+-driven multidrug efflux pump